jgi:PPOX class probable F420-dependent enzyme
MPTHPAAVETHQHLRSHLTDGATPFVTQRTVALTTYRRNGTPVSTAVSIAVDGDRAVFRSFAKAGKTRRLRRNPAVEVAPSRFLGRPTGPAVRGTARLLDGAKASAAARLLRRKAPHKGVVGYF